MIERKDYSMRDTFDICHLWHIVLIVLKAGNSQFARVTTMLTIQSLTHVIKQTKRIMIVMLWDTHTVLAQRGRGCTIIFKWRYCDSFINKNITMVRFTWVLHTKNAASAVCIKMFRECLKYFLSSYLVQEIASQTHHLHFKCA